MTTSAFGNLFVGKTVVITGASNGIGKAAMDAYLAAGATVIAHLGRDPAQLEKIPKGVTAWTGDFTDPEQQSAFISFVDSTARTVDVLVNNAGTMFGRFPADTLTEEQYSDIIELNQHAVVRITRGLLPALKRSGDAAIVNTVSISASTGGSPGSSIYSASKAFVSTYSRGLASSRYSSKEKLENTRKQIPLLRLGQASDCAPTFLFLSSSELSGYITGQVIEINGGQR